MATWAIINGAIYLISFALIGWMLLDASKVSKK